MTDLTFIKDNIQKIQNEISETAKRVGRNPDDVTLIAVSKTYPAGYVAAALHAGVTDAGENKIQEAVPKIESLENDLSLSALRWHLIGHLQSNKAKAAVAHFDMIHSLDSLKLARELDKQAKDQDKLMSVLMQINVSGEESKGGFSPDEATDAVKVILEDYQRLTIRGFMTMAPLGDPESARPVFKALREFRDSISKEFNDAQFEPIELSMGMSADYKVAIEEGATMVRIGSAIFGARPPVG